MIKKKKKQQPISLSHMLSPRSVFPIPSCRCLQRRRMGRLPTDTDLEEAGESINREGGFMPEMKAEYFILINDVPNHGVSNATERRLWN